MQDFDITTADIDRLMSAFYRRIRRHETLGPIFMRAVGDDKAAWQHHESKIASFWRNAIGIDRGYEGTPMRVHLENHDIQPEHFQIWLELFRDVARQVLSPRGAEQISDLADRIGRGMSLGIANGRLKKGAAPIFDDV